MEEIKSDYSVGCLSLLESMGVSFINGQKLDNWCKQYGSGDAIVESAGSSYDSDYRLLEELFNFKQLTIKERNKVKSYQFDDKVIAVDHLTYPLNHVNQLSTKGFIMSSVSALKALRLQKIWCIDCTFNVTKWKECKLITLVWTEEGGTKTHVGAVATLPTSESQENFEVFFKGLKKMIKEYTHEEGFPNLNFVITDDSKALINGIQNIIGDNVRAVLCTWHRSINFYKNLDKAGADKLVKAVYEKDAKKAREICLGVLTNYSIHIQYLWALIHRTELTKQMEKNNKMKGGSAASSILDYEIVRYSIDAKKKIRTVKIDRCNLEAAVGLYRKFFAYVVRAMLTMDRWCLGYRIMSTEPIQFSKVGLTEAENSFVSIDIPNLNVADINNKDELMKRIKEDYGACIGDGRDLKDVVAEVVDDFVNIDQSVLDFDAACNVGSKKMKISTQNNESIHNAFKNHYGMSLLNSLLMLFNRLESYFTQKHYQRVNSCDNNISVNVLPEIPESFSFLRSMKEAQRDSFFASYSQFTRKSVWKEFEIAQPQSDRCSCNEWQCFEVPCTHMLLRHYFRALEDYEQEEVCFVLDTEDDVKAKDGAKDDDEEDEFVDDPELKRFVKLGANYLKNAKEASKEHRERVEEIFEQRVVAGVNISNKTHENNTSSSNSTKKPSVKFIKHYPIGIKNEFAAAFTIAIQTLEQTFRTPESHKLILQLMVEHRDELTKLVPNFDFISSEHFNKLIKQQEHDEKLLNERMQKRSELQQKRLQDAQSQRER
ncbi:unnamed protein product [Ambrosiozyma monospora]|uniref:Unnamed protein product n=1 Tax=Ambrosiozyma monospora TaxID=43982 RepID=A0A9W6WEX4_AMBMO|nr:unnamed protein product [Ambrosiozyma monospora]